MLRREIEKEIQQENKVILNFTLRQAICLLVAAVCSIVIAVFLGLDFSAAIYPCFLIGLVCFAFGWVRQDGLTMEKMLFRRLQTFIYKNDVRLYRTKNRYVGLFNREYDRRRQIDGRDRKLKKKMKKEQKAKNKAAKNSRMKKIV